MRLFGRRRDEDEAEATEATERALERTRSSVFGRLGGLFSRGDVTDELWESLGEVLIGADAGVETTSEVLDRVRARSPGRSDEVREALAEELVAIPRGPAHRTNGPSLGP